MTPQGLFLTSLSSGKESKWQLNLSVSFCVRFCYLFMLKLRIGLFAFPALFMNFSIEFPTYVGTNKIIQRSFKVSSVARNIHIKTNVDIGLPPRILWISYFVSTQ